MKTIKYFALVVVLFVASCSPRVLPYAPMQEAMVSDPALLDGNYRTYVFKDWSDTRLERDYEAFYISHYGRHGSRYCTSQKLYDKIYKVLSKADAGENLTPFGRRLWKDYVALYEACHGKAALLTDRGREEQTALGKEMYAHYPSVFKPGSRLFACSTNVERVIESMNRFLAAISDEVSGLEIAIRSEEEDFRFLNGVHKTNPKATQVDFNNTSSLKNEWKDDWDTLMAVVPVKNYMSELFKDPSKLGFKDDGLDFAYSLYNVLADCACVGEQFAPMTGYMPMEVRLGFWRAYNLRNYKMCGPDCKTTGGRQWAIREVLMRDFLEKADEDLLSGVSARLRFGHDWPVAALLPLLDAEGWNISEDDPFKIERVFSCSDVTMASNMQMIFFRTKKGGDKYVVRLMYNGEDVSLPIKRFRKAYYRWEDLRPYIQERIDVACRILEGKVDARTTLSGNR